MANPIVTGTSVLGIKYNGGILLAADTLGSYGSMARFRSLERIRKVGEQTLIGASGEYGDFQYLMDTLDDATTFEYCLDDGHAMQPQEVHSYVTRIMYNRRSKMKPLFNSLVVAGVNGNGTSHLGITDQVGTSYTGDVLATGYGAYIALPLLRQHWRENMTREDALKLLEECMRVLFYRDARTINKIQVADATATGTTISDPYALATSWNNPLFVNPHLN